MRRSLFFFTMLGLAVIQVQREALTQTISERIRDPSRKPDTPVVVGVLGEPIPLTVEELASRSDLVVEATLSRLNTHIDPSDTAVVTDFAIAPVRVLAGALPAKSRTPGISPPLVLSVYGGEVLRDGVTVRAENHGLEPLKNGATYLLFLRGVAQQERVYQIFNDGVFEISGDTAKPVASRGGDLYRDFSQSYRQIAGRIAEAARKR